jgi:hypothetical protein
MPAEQGFISVPMVMIRYIMQMGRRLMMEPLKIAKSGHSGHEGKEQCPAATGSSQKAAGSSKGTG